MRDLPGPWIKFELARALERAHGRRRTEVAKAWFSSAPNFCWRGGSSLKLFAISPLTT